MVVTIKLRRKLANMPDEGRNIKVIWEDLFNPLRDEAGVIQRTDIINPVTGVRVPAYPEFCETVAIPANTPITQEAVDALILPALENAKLRAQIRAENLAAKTTIRAFVNELNSGSKIDFEGTVVIPTE